MKVKVTVLPGRSGTKLASSEVRVVKTGGRPRVSGKPLYQPRAEIDVHLLNKNGQPRARGR